MNTKPPIVPPTIGPVGTFDFVCVVRDEPIEFDVSGRVGEVDVVGKVGVEKSASTEELSQFSFDGLQQELVTISHDRNLRELKIGVRASENYMSILESRYPLKVSYFVE